MRGKEVPNPCSSIRLFSICEAMKWAHLPVPGGLYDQHPDFLDQIKHIFMEKGKYEEAKSKQEQRDAQRKTGRAGRVT